ncbi:MAG: hypothetical protein ACR2NZ_03320 [Rubripirellula sp.]
MKLPSLIVALLFALPCGNTFAQDKSSIDWDAEYKQLLKSDPGVLRKVQNGMATKEDVIQWLQETHGKKTKAVDKIPATKAGKNKDLSGFQKKLGELVASGKLSKEDAAKLAATVNQEKPSRNVAQTQKSVDWDAEYEQLLKSNPAVRQKVEQNGTTKEKVIEFLKQKAAAKDGQGKLKKSMRAKPGARKGSSNFYAIVIGKLRSKDIELGELELDVDYVLSDANWAKEELVGQRVRLVGVAGAFLDNLLRIKRGETLKVRTGDYNPETKVLGFGYKFQVLESAAPFKPEDFGVPPKEFRGFSGELLGKVVEAQGYEVLLEIQESKPTEDSKARNAESILGKRIRIAGFYQQHADAFADLHEGDKIRVSVAHHNPDSDAFNVTDVLKRVAN